MDLTLTKRERIVSRKLMERLFSRGHARAAFAYPLRAVYLEKERTDDEETVQILVSVSKRHFKRAVKRNRVKRQIREAYRHHKQMLKDKMPEGKALALAFIWQTDELCDSRQVERSMRKLLERINIAAKA